MRATKLVAPVALAGLAGTAITVGVWAGAQDTQVAYPAPIVATAVSAAPAATPAFSERAQRPTRSDLRPALDRSVSGAVTAKTAPEPKVIGRRYATESLNIRAGAEAQAKVLTVVDAGTKLTVTDTVTKGYRLVEYRDKSRWVTDKFLTKKKPTSTSGGLSTAACSSGSAMESGLTEDAVRVHRALCARYPQVASFGGRRPSNDFHGSGRAVDAMISDSTVGWQMARWVQANAKRLGVSEVIYSQKIWTVQRGSEGWRSMSDRGSATANHYDHVHVSVYGNSGTG